MALHPIYFSIPATQNALKRLSVTNFPSKQYLCNDSTLYVHTVVNCNVVITDPFGE